MLTLLEKLYGPRETKARATFDKLLAFQTAGLDVEAKLVGKSARNWIQVEISGSESTIVTNYLRKRFGLTLSLPDVRTTTVLTGKVIDSKTVGYGVYVDVGLSVSSPLDVLIPLYRLRSHLVDGKKLPLRKIIDLFCLHDNFPLSIRLIGLDTENKKFGGELSDTQIKRFRDWLSESLDRIIVLGTHHEQLKIALRKSGIRRDVASIEELGFLEYALLCKLGSDAPGIIKVLGPYLPKVPLYTFSPRKIDSALGGFPCWLRLADL